VRRANRPRSLRSNKSRVWRTSLTGEAKATQSRSKFGCSGLFDLLLGRLPTGSSLSASVATNRTVLTTLYHFVPHLTCKSFIVNRKLKGQHPALVGSIQTTSRCGLRLWLPQDVGFTAWIHSPFIRFDFSCNPRRMGIFLWKSGLDSGLAG
jgi:hypothetical protein